MLNTDYSPWPCFTQEEIDAVSTVLASNKVNYWTGTEGRSFETEFAAWAGTDYAIALHNGTLALELALRALNVGPGDEVIVTPRSFIASASSVVTVGAAPVFADIDPVSQNLTADTIAAVLGPKTKAIILVHLAGFPCDMDPIMALAKSHGLKVIEDCAQAHGARYQGRPVGSIGDIGAWSFCQDKIMTTGGEGGMVTTNDYDLWSKMWSYKDHGKSWEAVYQRAHPPGFRWLHESFGSNFRMLEVQAAIGRIQLRRMPEWTMRRQQIAQALSAACSGLTGLIPTPVPNGVEHAYYRFTLQIYPNGLKPNWNRDTVMAALTERGLPAYVGASAEIYREAAFENTPYRPGKPLPMAQQVGARSLALLTHPTLKDNEVARMAAILRDVGQEVSFSDKLKLKAAVE